MSSLMRHGHSRLTENRESAADKPDWARRPRLGVPAMLRVLFSVASEPGKLIFVLQGRF